MAALKKRFGMNSNPQTRNIARPTSLYITFMLTGRKDWDKVLPIAMMLLRSSFMLGIVGREVGVGAGVEVRVGVGTGSCRTQ